MKKVIMMLLGIAFAGAAWALDPVTYLTWNASTKKLAKARCSSYTVVTKDTVFEDGKWYVVTNTIERYGITVNGEAHLILCDGASLKVTGAAAEAGINVGSGKSLTIYGQSEGTGKLDANGGFGAAGIGGNAKGTCGAITINGGMVKSTGGDYGAGIGCGEWNASAATITINAGEIEATGGQQGAGIGSGNYYGYGGSRSGTDVITINGGTITATGGQYGAGIGSGSDGLAATVTINGGTITASTKSAEAIGQGDDAKAATTVAFAEGVEFSIVAGDDESSATETTVADYKANRGAKYVKIEVLEPQDPIEYLTWDADAKAMVATNTTSYTVVTADTATFEDKKWYVVTNTIECGAIKVNGAAHLILCDEASLTVTGGARVAGIEVPAGKSLTIYGQASGTGALIANGGNHEAGIGGVDMGACGNITINGGTITANGVSGAGIGGGAEGAGGTVTINAGTITASSSYGAGIGAGQSSSAHGVITFAEGVEFSIVAGDDEASATEKTVTEYMVGRSAKYVKIDSAAKPKVTIDEIIEGEDWTTFDVAYTLDNLEEGVDYKVIIDVTAGGVTKSITNATDLVAGSFTNTVDTVALFGSKVFDGEAKVVLSLEADGKVISSATEKTVSILPPPVEYFTWDAGTKALVAATNQTYEVVTAETATFEDGWYIVTNTIERGAIKVNGAAHLILCDGASLTVTGNANKAGIEVPADKSLTIYGQSEGTGELKATGGKDGAGIGGNYKGTCGTITINGGKITATSSYSGAGIGGGYWCNNPATITINGGTVKATGGENGAGIGSGDYYAYGGSRIGSDIITINGGEIEANGGKFAAGIGCGSDGRAVMVTINGGKVTAIGGRKGAGIGAGDDSYTATIVVNGGKIKAIGGDNGAGIGGGDGVGVPVTITVNDGEIEAIGGQQGAGIGSGNYYQFNGSRSGTDVITINGGTIKTTGGVYSAGIGSGAFGLDATVTINGGAITASTTQAEAIGSGYSAVSPTTVTFGEDMGFRIEAGVDSATAEVVSTADFAADHSAAYASCTSFDPVNVSFPVVAGLKYTVVVDGEEYIGAISGETYTVAVPNGSTVTITYSPANSTITLGTGITNPVTLTNITEAKAFTKADLPSVSQTPISYLAWDDEKKELYTEQTTNFIYEVVTEKTKKLDDGLWYVVNTGVERGGVKVNGSAHLILCDGASLTVTGADNEAGIEVAEGRSLTIYGQENGTGKLEATGGNYGAGIGGKVNGTCGTMTINGGTITAIGGRFGAGIGGGSRNVNAVTITINGGEIEAIGGQQGAGIGSGNYYKFNGSRSGPDVITINGGTIKAAGGTFGAGIGSGSDGLAATVTINGGTITASTVPGQGAEAIGNGGDAVAGTTVAFGTALASRYVWTGASATTGEMMTTAAFATNHSAAYAEVPIETYTVAYDGNGAAGVMSNDVFAVSREATLKKNAFTTPLGYDFAGWATNSVGDVVYDDEATGTDFAATNATLTLYAKWNASTNGVKVTSFTNLTNTIEKATEQASTLPITIGFTSKVEIPESATLPTLPTGTGYDGLKYVGDEEVGSNLWVEDGVLYGDVLRGEVTVDALRLMRYAMGGSISSFQSISEGETTVTNAVVMLLGDDGKAYFNDTDDVDQMITDVLAADPRPTTVKLYEVKGAMVTFNAMGGLIEAGVDPLGNEYEGGVETNAYLCLPDTGYVLPKAKRAGYKLTGWFDGWKPDANVITNNQVIVDYAPQSLYAQWTSTAPTPKADELHISDVTNNVPVTEIAAKAYINKTSVKTVTTPLYLKKICNRAFMGCTALEKLTVTATRDYETLNPTKATIEQNAFSGCTSLEELLIAGDIEKIGQSAFQNCAKLKKIIFRGDEAIAYDPGAFYRCGYANGTDELKVYMSSAFQAANAQLISDFQAWNTQVKIIDKVDVEQVTGETTVSIPAGLVAGKRVAIVVQTSVKGTPDKEDVDIELSTDLATWTPITEGVEKTAYPDGTVMIEITVPNAPSAFFRAVVKEN